MSALRRRTKQNIAKTKAKRSLPSSANPINVRHSSNDHGIDAGRAGDLHFGSITNECWCGGGPRSATSQRSRREHMFFQNSTGTAAALFLPFFPPFPPLNITTSRSIEMKLANHVWSPAEGRRTRSGRLTGPGNPRLPPLPTNRIHHVGWIRTIDREKEAVAPAPRPTRLGLTEIKRSPLDDHASLQVSICSALGLRFTVVMGRGLALEEKSSCTVVRVYKLTTACRCHSERHCNGA